jgi:hypothetical protein
MDKVYQVFVSSTFTDLKGERLQVSNTLAKAGYIAAGMELFPATDQQQLEYIKRIIDRSDYYVVVLGGRYGSLADETTSFTEKEFEYAKSKGIPILAFLHENPRALAVDDSAKAALLAQFREKLADGRMVEFWSNANDLCTKVVIAVANAANLTPGVGWVRGDQAIDPKVLQETERLRIEIAELRQKLAGSLLEELTFDPNLLGPTDTMQLTVALGNQQPQAIFEVGIGDIFVAAYDAILTGHSQDTLSDFLGIAAAQCTERYSPNQSYSMDSKDVVSLRNQLEALGLVQPLSGRTSGGFPILTWSVTEKGQKYAAIRNAKRRATSVKT